MLKVKLRKVKSYKCFGSSNILHTTVSCMFNFKCVNVHIITLIKQITKTANSYQGSSRFRPWDAAKNPMKEIWTATEL